MSNTLTWAAFSGFLAVSLGAFGAHGLKGILQENQTQEIWQTAVNYHFYHTLVLLALGFHSSFSRGIAWSFALGILIFSGSLYVLAITNIKVLGAITPIGGVAFLVGWAWLFFASLKSNLKS